MFSFKCMSQFYRCSHASPMRQEKEKKYQVISAKSHNVFFNFKTSRKKTSLFSLQNIKYKGERKKKKSLDVTGFTDKNFQLRGNSIENIAKTTFSPFFNESNILEIKPLTIFNARCSIKMQYHNSLNTSPVLQNCTDC